MTDTQDDVIWHRFDYDYGREWFICTLPPPHGWAGRPECFCDGCGVTVTAEETVRAFEVPPKYVGDTLLSLLVHIRPSKPATISDMVGT